MSQGQYLDGKQRKRQLSEKTPDIFNAQSAHVQPSSKHRRLETPATTKSVCSTARWVPPSTHSWFNDRVGQVVEFMRVPRELPEYPCEYKGLCWHCCHTFDHNAIGCPVKFHVSANCGEMTLIGFFCSWNCALTWGEGHSDRKVRDNIFTWISYAAWKLKGGDFVQITPALPRYSLQAFGGNTSIEEFRQALHPAIKITTNMSAFKIIPVAMEIYKEDDRLPVAPNTLSIQRQFKHGGARGGMSARKRAEKKNAGVRKLLGRRGKIEAPKGPVSNPQRQSVITVTRKRVARELRTRESSVASVATLTTANTSNTVPQLRMSEVELSGHYTSTPRTSDTVLMMMMMHK